MARDTAYVIFLSQAICSPMKNPNFYYYFDESNFILICLSQESYLNANKTWIELPKLSTEEKKTFIIDFANTQQPRFKRYILDFVKVFNEESYFDLQNELRKLDFDLGFWYSIKSLDFLWHAIEVKYYPYNLNSDMRVEFHVQE